MKRCVTSLFVIMMIAFGPSLFANQPVYADCCDNTTCFDPCDPCAPCAPTCGTGCGINWAKAGVAVPVVIAIIAGATSGGSHSH